ncbi:MAG: cyclic pyranopterin monophosphate synthase MoaC [Acidimicrobiia bacterium]
MNELGHFDDQGNARMVDVAGKDITARRAVAEATVTMQQSTADTLFGGQLPKGDAVAVARVAAILAAKRTAELIPLCHPLPLDAVDVAVEEHPSGVRLEVTVRTTARTGGEMEAMTAAAIGAVTVYDMVKGVDRSAAVGGVRLLAKSGGRSGDWVR